MFEHLNSDNTTIQNILEHAEIEETVARISIHFTLSSITFIEKIMEENKKIKKKEKTLKNNFKESKHALELATREVTRVREELERNYQRLEVQKKLVELEKTKHDMAKLNSSIFSEKNNEGIDFETRCRNNIVGRSIDPKNVKRSMAESSIKYDSFLETITENEFPKRLSITLHSYAEEDENLARGDFDQSMESLESAVANLHKSLKAIDEIEDENSIDLDETDGKKNPFLESNISNADDQREISAKSESVKYPGMTCSFSSFCRWIRCSAPEPRPSSMSASFSMQ